MGLKLVTYNINGLPNSIDLKKLPIILKPLSWIYKLINNTTIYNISDEDKIYKTTEISNKLKDLNADIIGIQEDFNYHENLSSYLDNYTFSTHLGKIDLSKVSIFPPRINVDGLNLITKCDKINVIKESIISWTKSYGYFNHGNDKLIKKGFRYYFVSIDDIPLNVYLVHMDADFYHPENCPDVSKDIKARKSQLKQLVNYILRYNKINYPTIIMGDTNSYDKYDWDLDNINNNLMNPINNVPYYNIHQVTPNDDVDKVFYINSEFSSYKLEVDNSYYDLSFSGLSDHFPFIVEFNILNNDLQHIRSRHL